MAETQGNSFLKALWGWVWPIALGCLIAFGIMRWVVGFAVVPSSSMYPTIPNPCYILVNHLETEFGKPYRGEVVLFHPPDDPSRIFVKRIIGLPGETITIHDGKVFVDGKALSEPYLTQPTEGNFGPYHVPPNSYFMLGDNRSVSEDSRWWEHKYVPEKSILGRAEFIVWPIGKAGPIH